MYLDLIDGIEVGHVGRYFSRYPCGGPSMVSSRDFTWEYQ